MSAPPDALVDLEGSPVAFAPALGVLRVDGPDATRFLNGQLTSHVAAQPVGRWTWSGWCTPKGRLRATFRLARTADDTWWLLLPAERAAPIAAGLTKYVMRSKVTITAPPIAVVAAAAAPDTAGDVLDGATGPVWSLADGRALTLAPVGSADPVAIGRADLVAAAPWVAVGATEQFLPQMLGLDALGAVRSGAGCYPGQEIVTRADSRGEVKRGLYRFALPPGAAVPAPGTALRVGALATDATAPLAGHVLYALAGPTGGEGLAVLDHATAASAPVLHTADATLARVVRVTDFEPAC